MSPDAIQILLSIAGYIIALMVVIGFVTSLVNGDGVPTSIAVGILFGVFTVVIIALALILCWGGSVLYNLSLGPIQI